MKMALHAENYTKAQSILLTLSSIPLESFSQTFHPPGRAWRCTEVRLRIVDLAIACMPRVSSDHSHPTYFIQRHLRHRPRPLSRRLHFARSMKHDLAGTTAMLPSKRPFALVLIIRPSTNACFSVPVVLIKNINCSSPL